MRGAEYLIRLQVDIHYHLLPIQAEYMTTGVR